MNETIFKVYNTEKAAKAFIAKQTGVRLEIRVIDNKHFVIAC